VLFVVLRYLRWRGSVVFVVLIVVVFFVLLVVGADLAVRSVSGGVLFVLGGQCRSDKARREHKIILFSLELTQISENQGNYWRKRFFDLISPKNWQIIARIEGPERESGFCLLYYLFTMDKRICAYFYFLRRRCASALTPFA